MGLIHHGITFTTEEHAAALLAGTITPVPILVPVLNTFTSVESQRHKDKITFVDAHNKKVATLQKAIMTLRRDLLAGLNQESTGALQSIHGHVALVTLSTNIIWTYLDSQYLVFTLHTYQTLQGLLAIPLLDSHLLIPHIANFRTNQRLLAEHGMGSTVIEQFLAFDLTLQPCPIIAQFTHEFKRQHLDVSI